LHEEPISFPGNMSNIVEKCPPHNAEFFLFLDRELKANELQN